MFLGGIVVNANNPTRENKEIVDLEELAYRYGLLGQSAHFLVHMMTSIMDIASSYLRQHRSIKADQVVQCYRRQASPKSIGYNYAFQIEETVDKPEAKNDWLSQVVKVVSTLQSNEIPANASFEDNLLSRVKEEGVVKASRLLLLGLLGEYKQNVTDLVAWIVEELSSNTLKYLVLLLTFGSACGDIIVVEEDDLNSTHLGLKPILIVKSEEGGITGHMIKFKSKEGCL
jgi:hypothetical protein